MTEYLAHPIARGALTGLVAAASVDYAAFRSWKSIDEARAYNWSTALFRWGQGLVTGALAAAGLDAAL